MSVSIMNVINKRLINERLKLSNNAPDAFNHAQFHHRARTAVKLLLNFLLMFGVTEEVKTAEVDIMTTKLF